ncbi:AraC family transcriptional regulator [Novosphingobium sp. FSW06-99]|uniref:AraC family transcriptional regulator n=1 Tax=Novosphingobium sp. FSW06-99 TaxID=1739113 RepID=UPI00076D715C|nr:AraC family transcriptional regulator [Novosphingobium sp. FSW06-99]KUR79568.1 AraC family transcriptional regulator [Novosphingobium sp. FSW06-99]
MIDRPENLTILPESESVTATADDLLSHVLARIRLTGDGVSSRRIAPDDHMVVEAEAAHVCIVTEGDLHIEGVDAAPVAIATGDLVMLPHGACILRSASSDAPAGMALCRFRFDADSLRGMVFALPGYIHIRRDEGADWLDGIVHFMMIEAGDVQPGAALMVSRLIDLVVIRTLRSWIQQGPVSGWLGGLGDVRIANALKAIHERPAQRWSIEAMATVAGMSRSSFCDRFTALVGRSPLRYHNELRLGMARDLLAKGGARVGEIGFAIGYESEAAFSRAYKMAFGRSPRADHGLQAQGIVQ